MALKKADYFPLLDEPKYTENIRVCSKLIGKYFKEFKLVQVNTNYSVTLLSEKDKVNIIDINSFLEEEHVKVEILKLKLESLLDE